jgi:1,4-dihydroxy-6-naphthoate synthase
VIDKSVDLEVQHKVDRLIKKSIEYAYSNYPELNDYIRSHSQEMSEDVMRKHIDLYVNEYSLNLGDVGIDAVKKLLSIYKQQHPEQEIDSERFYLS